MIWYIIWQSIIGLLSQLTRWAALTQLLLSAFSAALTEQLVVAHQQFHWGKLVEAGLDGALLGAGDVTVGQCLERPLVVLILEIISRLSVTLLLWRTWRGRWAVSRTESQADLRYWRNQVLYSDTLPCTGWWWGRGGGDGRKGGSMRGWRMTVDMAEGGRAWGPLALWSLTVGIVTAVLRTWVSFTAIWKAAGTGHLAHRDSVGRASRHRFLFRPLHSAARPLPLERAGRPPSLLFLEEKYTSQLLSDILVSCFEVEVVLDLLFVSFYRAKLWRQEQHWQ